MLFNPFDHLLLLFLSLILSLNTGNTHTNTKYSSLAIIILYILHRKRMEFGKNCYYWLGRRVLKNDNFLSYGDKSRYRYFYSFRIVFLIRLWRKGRKRHKLPVLHHHSIQTKYLAKRLATYPDKLHPIHALNIQQCASLYEKLMLRRTASSLVNTVL
jgi:hypothetical protein